MTILNPSPVTGALETSVSQAGRANYIRVAGVVIILLSAGAALLPFLGAISGTVAIGLLLLIAGVVEMLAARLRREARSLAILAGAATAVECAVDGAPAPIDATRIDWAAGLLRTLANVSSSETE